MTLNAALLDRSNQQCELCGGTSLLQPYRVESVTARNDDAIVVCEVCAGQLTEDAALDAAHWRCLQGSIWSEHPAVQVASWRMLQRLSDQAWALELLEQAYLQDDVLSWAREGAAPSADPADSGVTTLDSNGTLLLEGDSVTVIKDLDVKGTSFVAKRGTLVKNIHLSPDPGLVEGKVNGVTIFLKTEFLKKA